MTAPPADRLVVARHARRRERCRRVPLRVVALAVTASAVLGTQLGHGVAASFTSQTGATTGTLSFAQLTASFAAGTDDLGGVGGTGGSSYTMTVSGLLLATSTHRFTTLTNTSSVTAALTGAVTASGLSGTMNVAVDACSVAWSLGLCSGTTTALLAATSVSGAPSVSYGSLAVNGVRYLRYTFTSTSATSSATLVAAAVPRGTGTGDRTAG